MSLKETIANNLRAYRNNEHLVQKEVAAKLEVKLFTYQSYEEARATPPLETLFKLKRLYKLKSIEDLLTEKLIKQ